jgi:hypothetical protein
MHEVVLRLAVLYARRILNWRPYITRRSCMRAQVSRQRSRTSICGYLRSCMCRRLWTALNSPPAAAQGPWMAVKLATCCGIASGRRLNSSLAAAQGLWTAVKLVSIGRWSRGRRSCMATRFWTTQHPACIRNTIYHLPCGHLVLVPVLVKVLRFAVEVGGFETQWHPRIGVLDDKDMQLQKDTEKTARRKTMTRRLGPGRMAGWRCHPYWRPLP